MAARIRARLGAGFLLSFRISAIDLLEEALHRDPTHARALALLGWSRAQGANQGFWRDPDAERARALDHGRRALALAADDPEVLTLAAGVMSLTAKGRQTKEFFSESLFELRKVVWPTRQEAMRITGVILVVVVIVASLVSGFCWRRSLQTGSPVNCSH